jgi:hypothetical protein
MAVKLLSPSEPAVTQQSAGTTPDDGTAQLLRAGIWILVVGGVAALMTATVFGGIGIHGPHTNSGWLALLLAMMCLPFGSMLTLLGAAKWLRNRRLARARDGRKM